MRIDPDDEDPNEAYEARLVEDRPHGPRGWWSIYCNGVYIGCNGSKEVADRYAADPAIRLEQQRLRDANWKVGHPGEVRARY